MKFVLGRSEEIYRIVSLIYFKQPIVQKDTSVTYLDGWWDTSGTILGGSSKINS